MTTPAHLSVRYGFGGLAASATAEPDAAARGILAEAGFVATHQPTIFVPADRRSVEAARTALSRLLTLSANSGTSVSTTLDPYRHDLWTALPAPQAWADDFCAGRADLSALARAVAERIPGAWTVHHEDWSLPDHRADDVSLDLWDGGSVSWATWEHRVPRASLLTSGDLRLIIVDNPLRRDRFIVGAMALPDADPAYDFLADPAAPHGIAVSADAARAAHRVATRLLPRYEQAAARLRPRTAGDAVGNPPPTGNRVQAALARSASRPPIALAAAGTNPPGPSPGPTHRSL